MREDGESAQPALATIANQMRLDRLAVLASASLTAAGVPHALIKGVTTARWLYDPPRNYRDVDLLVPRSRLRSAVTALRRDGVAEPRAGRLGEEASHSQVLLSPEGFELDVHVTLPTLPTPTGRDADRVWQVLEGHLGPFDLDGATVPALDPPGRTLVLAMHYIASGFDIPQVGEDLRRALEHISEGDWTRVLESAVLLGIEADVDAAQSRLLGRDWRGQAPDRVRLRLGGSDAAVIQLQAILTAPKHRIPGLILRELFASPDMLRRQLDAPGSRTLGSLYLARWRMLTVSGMRALAGRADHHRSQ